MVGREETDRHGTDSKPGGILRQRAGIKIAQRLRDIIVEDLGIVLLHHALHGRNGRIIDPVSRGIPLHVPVGHPQRQIGVRIEGFAIPHHHLSAHVVPHQQIRLHAQALPLRQDFLLIPGGEGAVKAHDRIHLQGCQVLLLQGRHPFRVGEYRLGEEGVRPSGYRPVKIHLLLEIVRLK